MIGASEQVERSGVGGQRAAPAGLDVAEQRGEVGVRGGARGVARDREERVDGGLDAVDLRERAGQLGRGVAAQVDRFELDAQRGERGAQLVGGVGAEGALARDEAAQSTGGVVERGGGGAVSRGGGAIWWPPGAPPRGGGGPKPRSRSGRAARGSRSSGRAR